MNTPYDLSRHVSAAPKDIQNNQLDFSKFTYSVADAVLAFHEASMSITDRTVQRYCHSGKLRAVRVDPDTRQLTDNDNYLFLIDPASIPERVAQLREKQEFVSPTIVATRPVTSRPDATSHDMSETVANDNDSGVERPQSDELKKLREKVMSLEIDKRVRDGLLDQMKEDRKELLAQLQSHVDTMTGQSRMIGQLETRLELSAPPSLSNDNGTSHKELADRDVDAMRGDNKVNYHCQNGV